MEKRKFKPNDLAYIDREDASPIPVYIKGAALLDNGIQYIVELPELYKGYLEGKEKMFITHIIVHEENLRTKEEVMER